MFEKDHATAACQRRGRITHHAQVKQRSTSTSRRNGDHAVPYVIYPNFVHAIDRSDGSEYSGMYILTIPSVACLTRLKCDERMKSAYIPWPLFPPLGMCSMVGADRPTTTCDEELVLQVVVLVDTKVADVPSS